MCCLRVCGSEHLWCGGGYVCARMCNAKKLSVWECAPRVRALLADSVHNCSSLWSWGCMHTSAVYQPASVYMFVRLSTMPACAQSTWDRSPLSVPSCPADWVDDSAMEPLLTVYLWLPF